jgi:hypothetical protein
LKRGNASPKRAPGETLDLAMPDKILVAADKVIE